LIADHDFKQFYLIELGTQLFLETPDAIDLATPKNCGVRLGIVLRKIESENHARGW
jgi:hypothetical protein